MQQVLGVVYNRVFSVVYMLINSKSIWVYTTRCAPNRVLFEFKLDSVLVARRTDPACRIAVWDIFSVQEEIAIGHTADGEPFQVPPKSTSAVTSHASQHRATLFGSGKDAMSECLSLCYLNSPVVVWTDDEGFCCPVQHVYLLFGLAVSALRDAVDGVVVFP